MRGTATEISRRGDAIRAALSLYAATSLILAGCTEAQHRADPWPLQCDPALSPREQSWLADHRGPVAEPSGLALSGYSAERCVRIAAVWEAQRGGNEEDIATRAIGICGQQVSDYLARYSEWLAEPPMGDPRTQSAILEFRRKAEAVAGPPQLIVLRTLRDVAKHAGAYSKGFECWRHLDATDVTYIFQGQTSTR